MLQDNGPISVNDMTTIGSLSQNFNESCNKGTDIVKKLTDAIETMKTQWKGDAAKAHIDSLGIIHHNLGVTIAKIESISALVRTQVGRMIDVENANGASYPTVSAATVTSGTIGDPIQGESGAAVIVDTEEADQNLENLKSIANQYNGFKSDYDASLSSIFQVWESGAGRGDIDSYNTKFGKESEEFVAKFDEVIKAYETAIANYKSIQSSPIE